MVRMESMTFGYGKRPLFEGLDLRLEPGAIHGLLGLNGAGKTSLLKIAAGALRPERGIVEVYGRAPGRREAAALADVCFVPEDPFFPALKPAVWVERYAAFRPAFERGRFDELFAELGLDADKPISKFSYGQRKKFAPPSRAAPGCSCWTNRRTGSIYRPRRSCGACSPPPRGRTGWSSYRRTRSATSSSCSIPSS